MAAEPTPAEFYVCLPDGTHGVIRSNSTPQVYTWGKWLSATRWGRFRLRVRRLRGHS